MHILIFNASPHSNGNTARLLQAFQSGLPKSAVVTQVDLYTLLPAPCVDCGLCRTENTCRFSDLEAVDMLLHRADAFVWALPVYNYSVPAPMKALLDRFQRYYEAAQNCGKTVFEKQNRPAVLLLSAGRTGLFSVDLIQKQITTAGRYVGFSLRETVFAPKTDREDISPEIISLARACAENLQGELL